MVLKLAAAVPPKAALWYGYGFDPYCNLIDGLDMAVPVFGPIPLDEIAGAETAAAPARATPPAASAAASARPASAEPVKALIITGDNVGAHAWKETSKALKDMLEEGGRIKVDITATPSKDLTDENLAKYDVLILNYKDTHGGPPESRWSDANKEAFLKAVRGGKGLVVYHFASSRLHQAELGRVREGGRRRLAVAGLPRPGACLHRQEDRRQAPDLRRAPRRVRSHGRRALPELDADAGQRGAWRRPIPTPNKPRGTGKDEPVIWVNQYGKGRVYENVLGHDTKAMADPNYQKWMRRGVIWAATGKAE